MLARYPTLLIAAALLITDAVAQVPGFPKLPIALPGAAKQPAFARRFRNDHSRLHQKQGQLLRT